MPASDLPQLSPGAPIRPRKYWLWHEEKQAGPFSLSQIMRMAETEPPNEDFPEGEPPEIDRETLFWSWTLEEWQPLKFMPEEWDRMDGNRDRHHELHRFGAQWAEYLAGGNGGCVFCEGMDGKIIPVGEVSRLPLEGCTCTPWPRAEWMSRHKPP